MERDYEFASRTHGTDLEDPAEIGRRAGERTVKRLGARKPMTGRFPVVYDPRVSAGLLGHLGEVTLGRSLLTAAFIWFGFVLTTMMVNHRFQSARWSLTLIDGGHWLGVLLVMGLVIGLFGT